MPLVRRLQSFATVISRVSEGAGWGRTDDERRSGDRFAPTHARHDEAGERWSF